MGYSYDLNALAATPSADGATFTVRATIANRGVAPAYYPVRLTLSYPCGGANTTMGDVGPLLPTSPPATFTSPALPRHAGVATTACVFLSSPRTPLGRPIIRFAIEEADHTTGVVRLEV